MLHPILKVFTGSFSSRVFDSAIFDLVKVFRHSCQGVYGAKPNIFFKMEPTGKREMIATDQQLYSHDLAVPIRCGNVKRSYKWTRSRPYL